jgi:WD40 repeat protein
MTSFQRHIAITIGINQYSHGIAPLQTAVQDAQTLAAKLKDGHNYQVTDLVDEAATLAGLRTLFHEKLPQLVTDQDCLVVYFAGHGIAKEPNHAKGKSAPQTEGPVGYLIPQDARPEDEGTFLPMQEMYRALESLPCRHFLLILDCCFAGAFRWASTRDVLVPEEMFQERFQRFQDHDAWQVLTSASHDQKALDILRDNRSTGTPDAAHSPFAAALFEALAGKADLIKDRVITATELYLYLRNTVETYSAEKQTPGLWPLPRHDRGEFCFVPKDFSLEELNPAPELNADLNPYRGLEAYEERHGKFFFGRDQLIKALYANHILKSPLTAVVGASGTGKSSLVKAGLIPYLKNESFLQRRQEFKDKTAQVVETWQILPILRPGNDPLLALAQLLLPLCQQPISSEAEQALQAFQGVVERYEAVLSDDFCKVWKSLAVQPKAQLTLVLDWAKTLENQLAQASGTAVEAARAKLETLTQAAAACVRSLKQQLQADDVIIQNLLAQWLTGDEQTHILFVIDQAEELITQSQEADRKRFIAYLESALAIYPTRLHCVLTVRMDFEPLVAQLFSPRCQDVWPTQLRMVVPPMNQDDLRQAIEGPADVAVLHFEPPSLVDDLINEVVQMPGALPLLSFTLSELYIKCLERFRDDGDLSRALTGKDYRDDLKKVSGALRSRANQEFDHAGEIWGEAGQCTLRNIMLRMVAFEGGELARRRVPKTELVYSEEEENQRVEGILNRLIDQRLVISGRTPEGEYVEPAHDALVRGWEKIAEWLNEEVEVEPDLGFWQNLWLSKLVLNRNTQTQRLGTQPKINLILQRQVSTATKTWEREQERKRRKDAKNFLWTDDPRLSQLRNLQKSGKDNWLNANENNFILKSVKQKARNNQKLIGIATSVLAVISMAAITAWIQRNTAIANEELALSRQLAAQSQVLQEEDPNLLELSALLAIESGKRFTALEEYSPQADRALRTSVGLMPKLVKRIDLSDYPVNSDGLRPIDYIFTDDGDDLLFFNTQNLSRLPLEQEEYADTQDELILEVQDFSEVNVDSVNLSASYLALVKDQKIMTLVDINQPENRIDIPFSGDLLEIDTPDIQFNKASDYLLVSNNMEKHQLWKISEDTASPEESFDSAIFSACGEYIITERYTTEEYFKEVIRLEDGEVLLSIPGISGTSLPTGSHGSDLSSQATLFVTGYSHGQGPEVWNVEKQEREISLSEVLAGGLTEIKITPNGKYLILGNRGADVSIWSIEHDTQLIRLNVEDEADWIEKIEINSQGNLMAVVVNNLVRIYEIPTGRELQRIAYDTEVEIYEILFSENSKFLSVENTQNSNSIEEVKAYLDIWSIQGYSLQIDSMTSIAAISPDNKHVIITRPSNKKDSLSYLLYLGEIDGKQVIPIKQIGEYEESPAIRDLKFGSSGQYFAIQEQEGIRIVDTEINKGDVFIPHDTYVYNGAFDFSEDGKKLIISDDVHLFFYEIDDPQSREVIEKDLPQRIDSIEGDVYPEFVGIYKDHEVSLVRDLANNQSFLVFRGEGDEILENTVLVSDDNLPRVWDFEISSDRELVAISGGSVGASGNNIGEGFIRIWSISSSSEEPLFLKDLESPVFSVFFSSDGKYLAGGSHVWEIDGGEIVNLNEAGVEVNIIGFAPNNAFVFQSSNFVSEVGESFESPPILHSLNFSETSSWLCARLNRNMTTDEWLTYMGDRPYEKTCPNLD